MAIEIVDFPSYKMVIFHSYVKLPGGKVRCKHVDLFEAPNVSHAHMSYSLLHQPLWIFIAILCLMYHPL